MFSCRQFVVDAGAGHVAGGVFRRSRAGMLVLEEFAVETGSSDPSLESGWMARTAQALITMAGREKMRGSAMLAVPGHLALTKFVKTPAVPRARRKAVIQFEAAQAIPYPLDAVAWDHLVVSGNSAEIEIMLTAVKRDVMENLCAAAESAGYPVHRAAASCLALYRAFRFNYPEATLPALVVDIGARSTSLLVIGAGGRFFARTFPLAGNAITVAVSAELQIDFAQAEMLKRRVSAMPSEMAESSTAQAAIQQATENFLSRLQLEVIRTVGTFALRTESAKPGMVYLTGGGSLTNGLVAGLADKLHFPVQRYDPLRNVELSGPARVAGAATSTHLLANLVGLAVSVESENESALLPPVIRAARAFRRRQPYLLGAVTLLALALVLPIRHFQRLVAVTEERTVALAIELRNAKDVSDGNRAGLREIAAVQHEIVMLRSLVAAKGSWLGFLGDLQDRLGKVEDVWLEQISILPPPTLAASVAASRVESAPAAVQLRVIGRLLDVHNPVSRVSADSEMRAKALLAGIARSPFVAAIGNERFDTTEPGLLRFDFTLTANPSHPL